MPSISISIKSLYDSLYHSPLSPSRSSTTRSQLPFLLPLPVPAPAVLSIPPPIVPPPSRRPATPDPLPIPVCVPVPPAPTHDPAAPNQSLSPAAMRRELDFTRNELAKSRADTVRLDDRCKLLERSLKETRELLRVRDLEVDKLRKARDKRRGSTTDPPPPSCTTPPPPPPPPSAPLPNGVLRRHRDAPARRQGSLDFDSPSTTPLLTTNGHGHHLPLNGHHPPDLTLSFLPYAESQARARAHDTYSTRTDSISGAQLLQALHDINTEILQFAASATDLCAFDPSSRPSSARAIQAMHDTSSRLGPNLARILSSRDHSQDPILVQLALQGCVSTCIIRALTSFCIGFSAKPDAVLSQVYSKMLIAEPQPTSSKWRSLAHRHIHATYPHLAENAISDLSDTILRWSADIFLIAGCTTYEYAASSSSLPFSSSSSSTLSSISSVTTATTATTTSKDVLRLRFGDQIRRIARAATRLARITREDIMSTSFDVVAVGEAELFDPGSMTDAFAEYGKSHGAVIATTELGLRCTTRVVSEEQPTIDGVLKQRVILQPKVVLESVLDVLDPR